MNKPTPSFMNDRLVVKRAFKNYIEKGIELTLEEKIKALDVLAEIDAREIISWIGLVKKEVGNTLGAIERLARQAVENNECLRHTLFYPTDQTSKHIKQALEIVAGYKENE